MRQPDMSEMEAYQQRLNRPLLRVPQSIPGRIVFGIGVVLWFMLLLTPCAMFMLAATGSIRIAHGNVPEPESQPLFQVNLIMSIEQRGLQFTRSVILPAAGDEQCIETYVSYALWQTDGTNENVVYCECYTATAEGGWAFVRSTAGTCEAR